jgi:energy-converting hydrogenase Eha subunit A
MAVGLLRGWAGAVCVWGLGVAATTPLRDRVTTDALSDFDLRSHLPWLVMSVLMALAAGGLSPSRSRVGGLAVVLPVPLIAAMVGAVAGFGGHTLTAEVLYVVEGVFGAVMGLFVTNLSPEGRSTGGY